MIKTEIDCLEIAPNVIKSSNDFQEPVDRYANLNQFHKPLNLRMSNFNDEYFVVDWQNSLEENSEVGRHW